MGNNFKGFIPKNSSNNSILNFFEILRKTSKHNFPGNFHKNTTNFKNHLKEIEKNNGFIENQDAYTDLYYGNKTLDFCGCEIIATYNAIYDLTKKHDINFAEMIDSFEKDGIVLSGYFGTAPRAIEDYLNKIGFKTKSSMKKEEYDEIGNECDSLILTVFNDINNIMNMVHTFNITKKEGKFYIHNNGYKCHLEPYFSITDLMLRINDGKAKDIFLIGIFKKKNL